MRDVVFNSGLWIIDLDNEAHHDHAVFDGDRWFLTCRHNLSGPYGCEDSILDDAEMIAELDAYVADAKVRTWHSESTRLPLELHPSRVVDHVDLDGAEQRFAMMELT